MENKTFAIGDILNVSFKARKAPDALVTESLDLFTKAEAKMTEAQNEIQKQIDEDAQKIRDLEANVTSANTAYLKLQRVKERLKNLVS